jgi:hypothetical protein
MEAFGEVDGYISALVGGEWSASRLYLFTLGERASVTH